MPRSINLLCAATCLLAACGPNIRTTYLTPAHPPRPTGAEVTVSSVDVPTCPFEELGLVTMRDSPRVHGPALLEAMKEEARRVGGHALVRLRQVPKHKGEGARGLSATIVRFTEDGCRN